MRNSGMSVILEGLNESRIEEGKQAIHVVRYISNDDKDAQIICNTRQYNKIKKTPGYKELDHAEIDAKDVVLHSNYISDYIEKYGLDCDEWTDDGFTLGHWGDLGYGYRLLKTSKKKPYGYGFNK